MKLELLEIALKKRRNIPYRRWRKQSNDWDQKTNFIYSTRSYSELLGKVGNMSGDLSNYALNRWYNFWSAMWIEYIFSTYPWVVPHKNHVDKLVDFTINGIKFDHKTSVFPQWFSKNFHYAFNHKEELIRWFYDNQSQEQRKHLKNRLFIVVYDSIKQEHWKVKAEISLIRDVIDSYMSCFDSHNLVELDFWDWKVLSDILWVVL